MAEQEHIQPAPEPLEPAVGPAITAPSGEQEVRHPDGRIEHPSVLFEHKDANFWWILRILGGALGFAVLVYLGISVFFQWYNGYQSSIKKSPYPLAPTPSMDLPAEPRLEQLERRNEASSADVSLRQQREAILNRYGATEEKDYVHIPIKDAMREVLSTLQSRKPPAGQDQHDSGLVNGGASNSGRLFRRPSP
jgi:hypothetical protein